jgi:hypothetical protein
MSHCTIERLNTREVIAQTTEADFLTIQQASKGLLFAIRLEELFQAALENYVQLELGLMEVSLRDLVYSTLSWSETQDAALQINRLLGNFLTTVKAYLDAVPQELNRELPESSGATAEFTRATNHEYDSRLGYRVLESLRNFHQHTGFSLHSLSLEIRREENAGKVHAAHFLEPLISVETLELLKKFKAAVLEELKRQGQFANVIPFVREYVSGLGAIHNVLQGLVQPDLTVWSGTTLAAHKRGLDRFPQDTAFVAARRGVEPVTDRRDEVYVSLNLIRRLETLKRRTQHVPHLANHYVSGKTPP